MAMSVVLQPDGKAIDILIVLHDVIYRLDNSPVFQSQIGGLMFALNKQGYRIGLITSISDNAEFDRVIGNRLREAGCLVETVPTGGFIVTAFKIAKLLRRVCAGNNVRQAYVRGIWGAAVIWIAGLAGQVPYVYDLRGDLADETLSSGTAPYKRQCYLWLERQALQRARTVTAVTGYLANIAAERCKAAAVPVVPCCADTGTITADEKSAELWRDRFKSSPDDVVLIYSGGLSHYQQIPAMLALWRALAVDPSLRFVFLTNADMREATSLLGDLSVFGDRFYYYRLQQSEVAAALAAADIGFMLRDERALNRAASPVKFPEYLCAGLSVVASPGTGDISELIEANEVGVLVNPSAIGEGLKRVRSLLSRRRMERGRMRINSRALACAHYDWSAYAGTFAKVYGPPVGALGRVGE